MNKIDWIRKLSSRKFWVAAAGFVAGLIVYCGGTPERAASTEGLILSGASIIVYMLAESIADSAHAGDSISESDIDKD